MCRLAAYLGEELFLDELIAKPRHSLMRQSLRAEQAVTATNGDGFGIGWYGERDEPGVYREVMPAWSDDNLLALSRSLRSRLFFAHVRAATSGGVSRHNCHPFRHGRYLFMHNGQIGGYAEVRRTLEAWLPDGLFALRHGATDSELLFLLAMARIQAGEPLPQAMIGVLERTWSLMQQRGIEQPLRFAAVFADGQQMHAFRFASDGQPPTLYRRDNGHGIIVASEPLCDNESGWELLPVGAVLSVAQDGCRLDLHALERARSATA
ncbi:MAG: class II glutamine amidotransferase [Rubrivivax sp.]